MVRMLLQLLFTGVTCAAAERPAPPVFGGQPVKRAFEVWLSAWRNLYVEPGKDNVPLLDDDTLPKAFKGVKPKVVLSEGGAAGGIVSEGMGYGLMLEGMAAARGDGWALELGLSLMRSWMGMVQGPDPEQILGGADGGDDSATKVDSKTYGVSAISGKGPAGVATWKFPPDLCAADKPWKPCHGSAADGDVDAVLGMVYLAGSKGYPEDFVDVVMRSVISFASADLGFPDMYRVLPDGKRVFVPKAGSQWGGLTPPGGRFAAKGPEWCYNPSYFAPAHYRSFRLFVKAHWRKDFDKYLPPLLNGSKTSAEDLMAAFDGAILGGYNILYYSSCESGAVANWVGVQAPCEDDDTLSCTGVPWAYTPYVGKDQGECSTSGTLWGSFGADATRTLWRVAMDYALYAEESEKVDIYWRTGWVNENVTFNARLFLNRVVTQYKDYAKCDAGSVGGCDCDWGDCGVTNHTRPWMLNAAFAVDTSPPTPGLTCDNVPKGFGQAWWAGFMSYPTFTAFIAPYKDSVYLANKKLTAGPMAEQENRNWQHAFVFMCDFSNFSDKGGWAIDGKVCQRTYFHVSQEAISTMVMSGSVPPVPRMPKSKSKSKSKDETPLVAQKSKRMPPAPAPEASVWECQHYDDDDQDDEWCQTAGQQSGYEYKWVGPDADLCGDCWCCRKAAKSTPKPLTDTVMKFSVASGFMDSISRSASFQVLIAGAFIALAALGAVVKMRRCAVARPSTSECEAGPLIDELIETADSI